MNKEWAWFVLSSIGFCAALVFTIDALRNLGIAQRERLNLMVYVTRGQSAAGAMLTLSMFLAMLVGYLAVRHDQASLARVLLLFFMTDRTLVVCALLTLWLARTMAYRSR